MLDHLAQGRLNFGITASGLPSDWDVPRRRQFRRRTAMERRAGRLPPGRRQAQARIQPGQRPRGRRGGCTGRSQRDLPEPDGATT